MLTTRSFTFQGEEGKSVSSSLSPQSCQFHRVDIGTGLIICETRQRGPSIIIAEVEGRNEHGVLPCGAPRSTIVSKPSPDSLPALVGPDYVETSRFAAAWRFKSADRFLKFLT